MKVIVVLFFFLNTPSFGLSNDSTKIDRKFSHHFQIGRIKKGNIFKIKYASKVYGYSLYKRFNDKIHYGIQLSYLEYEWDSNNYFIYGEGKAKNYAVLIGLKYYLIRKNKVINFYTKGVLGVVLNKESSSYYGDYNKYRIGFSTGIYFEMVNHLEIGLSVQGLGLNGLLTAGIKI